MKYLSHKEKKHLVDKLYKDNPIEKRKIANTIEIYACIGFVIVILATAILAITLIWHTDPDLTEEVLEYQSVSTIFPDIKEAEEPIEDYIAETNIPKLTPNEYTLRITHYSDTGNTARCVIGEERSAGGCMTVAEGLQWAEELGIKGICAVKQHGPQMIWSVMVRHEYPAVLRIMPGGAVPDELCGDYLAIDRIGWGSDVDLWIDSNIYHGNQFAGYAQVREVDFNWDMFESNG